MALHSTGPISLADINIELGNPANTPISLGDAAVRALLDDATGQISLSSAYGKSDVDPTAVQLTNSFNIGRTNYVTGDTFTLTTSGSAHAFNTKNMASIKVTIYGARGGISAWTGDNGGIVIAQLDVSSIQDTACEVHIGGIGTDTGSTAVDQNITIYPGGYNGGGAGSGSRSGGGGGRSDIRIGSTATNEIIVAGGGGGAQSTLGTNAIRVNGSAGCTGYAGEYPQDNGGGGGGYEGGLASCADDASDAGSGSNYIHPTYLSSTTQNSRYARTGGASTGYALIEVLSVG